jgi:hypothetical protein
VRGKFFRKEFFHSQEIGANTTQISFIIALKEYGDKTNDLFDFGVDTN